jgi:serine/threonine protein kinase
MLFGVTAILYFAYFHMLNTKQTETVYICVNANNLSSCRSIRQELSILIDLNHPHILQLKGFCLNPLSLILEFAPMKSLDKILAEYKRAGPRLDPYVLQKCVVQVG